jgi:hypothetical protein
MTILAPGWVSLINWGIWVAGSVERGREGRRKRSGVREKGQERREKGVRKGGKKGGKEGRRENRKYR